MTWLTRSGGEDLCEAGEGAVCGVVREVVRERGAHAATYERERVLGLDGARVEEALPVLAAEPFEPRVLLLRLDALGDDAHP